MIKHSFFNNLNKFAPLLKSVRHRFSLQNYFDYRKLNNFVFNA